MRATAILETVLYAADPASCAAFYQRVFGLVLMREAEGRFCFLRCGDHMLLIFAPLAASEPKQQKGIPAHGCFGQGHICFAAASPAELDRWKAQLTALDVAIEYEQDWPEGGRSLYMRDPAGNSVEIAERTIWGM